MKLAFCLYNYFPFGGLQRDFLRITQECLQRGHEVDIYTMSWEGTREPGLNLITLTVSSWQNHKKCQEFSNKLHTLLKKQPYDLTVGFNKIPLLDVYYAADVCFQSKYKTLPLFKKILPRYRSYLKQEQTVFSHKHPTYIFSLSDIQKQEYQNYYALPDERYFILPPGIAKDRQYPPYADIIRNEVRKFFNIKPHQNILLMVGSGFKTKGLDRSLQAFASLPKDLRKNTFLWVIGQDNPKAFIRLAEKLNIESHVHFLGGRHDVMRFYLAADLLIHPAYFENTGTVLLEALIVGLPILTVDVCGYAHYIEKAKAGLVLSSPFQQSQLNIALKNMLSSEVRNEWRENGLEFAKTADIFGMPQKFVQFIEQIHTKIKICT